MLETIVYPSEFIFYRYICDNKFLSSFHIDWIMTCNALNRIDMISSAWDAEIRRLTRYPINRHYVKGIPP